MQTLLVVMLVLQPTAMATSVYEFNHVFIVTLLSELVKYQALDGGIISTRLCLLHHITSLDLLGEALIISQCCLNEIRATHRLHVLHVRVLLVGSTCYKPAA